MRYQPLGIAPGRLKVRQMRNDGAKLRLPDWSLILILDGVHTDMARRQRKVIRCIVAEMHQLVELERGHGADEQSKYDDE
jgi:hypothetical protein